MRLYNKNSTKKNRKKSNNLKIRSPPPILQKPKTPPLSTKRKKPRKVGQATLTKDNTPRPTPRPPPPPRYLIKATDNRWVKHVKHHANREGKSYMCSIESAKKSYSKS